MKVLNYLTLIWAYKNRKYLFLGGIAFVVMVVMNLMIDDFFRVEESFWLLVVKWVANIGLIAFIGWSLSRGFRKEKEEILKKEKLTSKTDLIIKKYKG